MAHKLRPGVFHIGPVKMIITIRHKNNQHSLTGHYRIRKAFHNLKVKKIANECSEEILLYVRQNMK